MKQSLAILALLVFGRVAANDLFVVVRTSDEQVYVRSICPTAAILPEEIPQRVRKVVPGAASWHAVGGVAPYTLISDVNSREGLVCFTVRDAMGNEATGCGRIDRVVIDLGCDPFPHALPEELEVVYLDKDGNPRPAQREAECPPSVSDQGKGPIVRGTDHRSDTGRKEIRPRIVHDSSTRGSGGQGGHSGNVGSGTSGRSSQPRPTPAPTPVPKPAGPLPAGR